MTSESGDVGEAGIVVCVWSCAHATCRSVSTLGFFWCVWRTDNVGWVVVKVGVEGRWGWVGWFSIKRVVSAGVVGYSF